MKPKLILLNGPLGIGKSTLAERYADDHPLTLRLDIDEVRTHISHWREQAEASSVSSKQMALQMARVHLTLGHDVIVPQIFRRVDFIEQFERIALEAEAAFYEVLLSVDKTEAVRRFKERGIAQGHAGGFKPGGLIDTGGREAKIESMYDEMMEVVELRPLTIVIHPEYGSVEGTYAALLDTIF